MIPEPTKVSVLMITYNQERYVGQAIESVLAQQTDFAYELVIGEDCSTDGTRAICEAYQNAQPRTVRLLAREKNLGMTENLFSTFAECTGEYLAIVEGDDFWTDPLKLQKQADYLDANPDCALVFARTDAFFQNVDRPGYEIPPPDIGPYTLDNLLKTNYIATCSVMYRKDLVRVYPPWIRQLEMLDWPLHVLYAQCGTIGFIDEAMAAYRIHAESTFSSRNVADNYSSILKFYERIRPQVGPRYAGTISRSKATVYRALARSAFDHRSWGHAVRYELRALFCYARSRVK